MTSTFILSKQVQKLLVVAHRHRQKIVLVTGVFDLLHSEHIRFLQAARKVGDCLVVGIESDRRVQELKGEGRPINAQTTRQKNLEELSLANAVFVLPEKFSSSRDHLALVKLIKPDILAVSSHTPHLTEKRAIMSQVGGRVVTVLPHNPTVSTTMLASLKKTN